MGGPQKTGPRARERVHINFAIYLAIHIIGIAATCRIEETIMWKVSTADALVGGLSAPGKMPCPSFSISAFLCITGSLLAAIVNSVCSNCYARKGRYLFENVRLALARRYSVLARALADADFRVQFVSAMSFLIRRYPVFRWHDSGDLQSKAHFALICDIARATPDTMHWLPTKEPRFAKGDIPANLIVRVSAPHIDQPAPKGHAHTSTVVSNKADATCRAFERKGKCGPCRMCWDSTIKNIAYYKH